MENKLCCILSSDLICEGCGKQWCSSCNAIEVSFSNSEWTDPKKHPLAAGGWKCTASGKIVNYAYSDSGSVEMNPLRLKVI